MAKGKVSIPFIIRIIGAVVGGIGFFVLAYQQTILGTTLVGIGSIIIALGES